MNGSISGFSGSYYATYDTVTHPEYILATAYYMGTRPLETAESTVKGVICGNPEIIYNIRNGDYREAGQDLGYGVGNATQIALAAAAIKKCGELSNKRKGKIPNQSAIIEGGSKSSSGADDIIQYEYLKSQYAADEIIHADKIGSGLREDPMHRAVSYLSQEQLVSERTYSYTGGDGRTYTLLQTQGQYNGIPNQVVPKGGY